MQNNIMPYRIVGTFKQKLNEQQQQRCTIKTSRQGQLNAHRLNERL